jgi:tetratricopeptide (TPR) repeat protein
LGHFDRHRYDWAVLDLTRALSLNPHGDAYYQRARAYFGLEDWSNTIADLDKAIHLQPNRAEAYELRGDAYAKLQNVEAALANYAEALKYSRFG